MRFCPQRGTIDQIWVLQQVIEKAVEDRSKLDICFVDLSNSFDSVPRHALTKILKDSGTEDEVVRLIIDLHDGTGCVMRNRGEISSRFEVTTGVRQGCVMSPVLFNLFVDRIKFEGWWH